LLLIAEISFVVVQNDEMYAPKLSATAV